MKITRCDGCGRLETTLITSVQGMATADHPADRAGEVRAPRAWLTLTAPGISNYIEADFCSWECAELFASDEAARHAILGVVERLSSTPFIRVEAP